MGACLRSVRLQLQEIYEDGYFRGPGFCLGYYTWLTWGSRPRSNKVGNLQR